MTLFTRGANSILESWKEDFDCLSVVPLSFHLEDEELYLNDFHVNVRNEPLSLLCVKYDIETIELYLNSFRKIQINIIWPEEDIPYVGSVWFGEGCF